MARKASRVPSRLLAVMALVPSPGADVWNYAVALDLREVERRFPALLRIVRARADIPGERQQPYFGCALTAAGKRAVAAFKKRGGA